MLGGCNPGKNKSTTINKPLSSTHGNILIADTDPAEPCYGTSFALNDSLAQPDEAGIYHVALPGESFRGYTNARATTITETGKHVEFCVDTGSALSLIDERMLKEHYLSLKIRFIPNHRKIQISGIGKGPITNRYVMLPLSMPTTSSSHLDILGEVHVVETLTCQILIGNNVLRPNMIEINWGKEGEADHLRIGSTSVPLNARQEDADLKRMPVFASKEYHLAPGTGQTVDTMTKHPPPKGDKGFLFEPKNVIDLSTHSCLSSPNALLLYATQPLPVSNFGLTRQRILKGQLLGHICPYTDRKESAATVMVNITQVLSHPLKGDSQTASAPVSGDGGPTAENPQTVPIKTDDLPYLIHYPSETKTEADISVHWGAEYKARVSNLINTHTRLFRPNLGMFNDGVTMPIPFRDPKDIGGLKQAPYGLSRKDKDAMDSILDPLLKDGRIVKVPLGTPSAAASPAFVVWKGEKPRVVVDLRKVNTKLYPDAYPLPKQDQILGALGGSIVFSSMDVTKGFFQQPIDPEDQWKTAFVTPHRGHEQLTVSTMGLANSPGFFQHRMESLFGRFLWQFVLVYVDDIIVFSRSLGEHLQHLNQVLDLLEASGVTLALAKCHFAYPTLVALGHHVSRLGLSTVREKTDAIRQLAYPTDLRQLEIGLGFFGYYRKFVPGYSDIAQPLLRLKTEGFKGGPMKGRARQNYADNHSQERGTFNFDGPCQAAWDKLKERLCNAPTLAFPDFAKGFILYCDGSKERGYGAALHQIGPDQIERPILFLSKQLSAPERNYWATELEVGALVWALKKLQAYVDGNDLTVYTDHAAIQGIFQSDGQGKRSNRLNNWALFLSKYRSNMTIIHRAGKVHKNADGLSRLQASTFTTSVLQIDDQLRKAIVSNLVKDKHLKSIYQAIKTQVKATESSKDGPKTTKEAFRYDRDTGLLYFIDSDRHERLCIPEKAQPLILTWAHDNRSHPGANRTYDFLRQNVYMPRMKRTVARYVQGCPSCSVSKPSRHPPYGDLHPIQSPPMPFAVQTMDFVGSLPPSSRGSTAILTVTDKFSKAIKLVPGRDTFTVVEWAEAYFRLVYKDWGAPQVIISDRDAKFTSYFWKALFKRASTRLAMTTAYHPASDGQSERTNQTVEIALRCLLAGLETKSGWEDILPDVEFSINTSANVTTGSTPFELLYGVEARTAFSPPTSMNAGADSFVENRVQIRQDAADAMRMAQTRMKVYFDSKHAPVTLTGSVYLRLATGIKKGYRLAGASKLSPVKMGPFRIKSRVGDLAYEIELPPDLQDIHPVISVAHLEQAPDDSLTGDRRLPPPGPLLIDGHEEWVVEKILGQEQRGGKSFYKVKWDGYSNPTWEPAEDIAADVPRLVRRFERTQR